MDRLPDPPLRRRVFHGRRHGKALRASQRRLLQDLLPRLALAGVTPAENPARTPLDRAALFGDGRPLWLEIGFGGGEHLAHQAVLHPEIGMIGCEPFVNGVAMLLTRIVAGGLGNLRLHPGDARDLIEVLPPAALSRVFLLYPDPWPKARHRARRFMNPENLAALARVMAPGSELRLATDIADYGAHALAAVAAGEGFAAVGDLDRAPPWPDWRPTRYEAKALAAGRPPRYLTFLRRDAPAAPVDRCAPID